MARLPAGIIIFVIVGVILYATTTSDAACRGQPARARRAASAAMAVQKTLAPGLTVTLAALDARHQTLDVARWAPFGLDLDLTRHGIVRGIRAAIPEVIGRLDQSPIETLCRATLLSTGRS